MHWFEFPDDMKWCHFACVADADDAAALGATLSRGEGAVGAFVRDRTPAFVARWRALPEVRLSAGHLGMSLALCMGEPWALQLSRAHPWLVARAERQLERLRALRELHAPEVIIAGSEALTRDALRAVAAHGAGDTSVLSELLYDDVRSAIACCAVSAENVGLGGWFELTNPVVRFMAGEDPWRSSALHPERPLVSTEPEPFDDALGPVFVGVGDELSRLITRLRVESVVGPSHDAAERTENPSHLRFVHGVGDDQVRAAAPALEAQLDRYAAVVGEARDAGHALLSWVGKNPAL